MRKEFSIGDRVSSCDDSFCGYVGTVKKIIFARRAMIQLDCDRDDSLRCVNYNNLRLINKND